MKHVNADEFHHESLGIEVENGSKMGCILLFCDTTTSRRIIETVLASLQPLGQLD